MRLLELPFFSHLDGAESILIAGAGGGFDVFPGLPLYFALRGSGPRVHLANLSFSDLHASSAGRLAPALFEVTADSQGSAGYFPEAHLARWLREQGDETSIYCFDRTGARPLLTAYRALVERLGVDTLVLVDGGTDSLMRGNEAGLGTPHEDIASIAAAHQLDLRTKLLVCLGFGVDTYHGVCHAHFLEAVADLIRKDAYLGAWSLTREMPEVRLFQEATDAVNRAMPDNPSIVCASILSAIDGRFGDYHATSRTAGSRLFINPLMSLYWCFQLDAVAERLLYLDAIRNTDSFWEMLLEIQQFRATCKDIKGWENLPM